VPPGNIAFLVDQRVRSVISSEVTNLDAQIDLVAAVADQLADLAGHELGKIFFAIGKLLANRPNDLGAVRGRFQPPIKESVMASAHGVRAPRRWS